MKPHQRLQFARLKAGFHTANAASKARGWPQRTYLRHELGETDFSQRMAAIYAEAFGVKIEWLTQPDSQDISEILASLSDSKLTELVKEEARVVILDEDGLARVQSVKGIWLISQS